MQTIHRHIGIPGIAIAAALLALAALAVFLVSNGVPSAQAGHQQYAAPTNLEVITLSATSVRLTWNGPERPSWWGASSFYTINYEKKGSFTVEGVGSVGSANGGAETITGLDAGAGYRFRVKTQSTAGHNDSPWTDWLTVTMPTVSVSNLGQSYFGPLSTASWSRAQSFTTGGHSKGYTLPVIEAAIGGTATDAQRGGVRAELWSSSGGSPGAKVADLLVPDLAVAGTKSFSARSSPMLMANTQYFFVFYTTDGHNVGIRSTGSNNEDDGALDGWSIGDLAYRLTKDPGATWAPDRRLPVSLMIRVNAAPNYSPTDLSALLVEGSTDGTSFAALTGDAAVAPAFDAATTGYGATVANEVTHVRLTPTVGVTGGATAQVGKSSSLASVTDGSASGAIALDVGANEIIVRVTAEDATTQDYTVTVTRQPQHCATSGSLTGLTITGTVTRSGVAVAVPITSIAAFDTGSSSHAIRVPSDLASLTFTPTWTETAVTGVILYRGNSDGASTRDSTRVGETTASGTALTMSPVQYPALCVRESGATSEQMTHNIDVQRFEGLSFGGATVDDKAYTAGAETPNFSSGNYRGEDALALALPEATGGGDHIDYTATGLPAGLSMGQDRIIRGTPEEATTSPTTVTYTATDDVGGTASLTFQVTVNPPVTFDATALLPFTNDIIEYTVGQENSLNITLPAASGGTGTLTYHLDNRDPRVSISEYATGLFFDPSTRVLSSGVGEEEPPAGQRYALSYWAEDENGAMALAIGRITVAAPPSLAAIDDQSFTVGDAVSLTLPEIVGGSWQVGWSVLRYRLEPEIQGLSFDSEPLTRTLTGTAAVTGSTELTYTVTDRNGVSASRSFTLTVAASPNAPASSPALTALSMSQAGLVVLDWESVEGATGYVVQVRAADGSYPAQAVESLPDGARMISYNSRTDIGEGRMAQAVVAGLTDGSYKVRAAAVNADGAGPWSAEADVTVKVGGL